MFASITTLFILLALLALGWAIWFVIALIRYIFSGEYELDKRLDKFTRR